MPYYQKIKFGKKWFSLINVFIIITILFGMWNNVENHLLLYLLMCKDIENLGYNMMSQWIKEKVKETLLRK